ncbi:hypothetical protein GWK08_04850 [Leptobacterium flavescens]|uniref:DUF3278 domain-containing protein n=1 Tax=Leptobacterium flavescens TaxID=472055 RepID=A0A6P0ULG8_9FLAO|nr:hypothetical protein [Leptobacterium flavescens]NER12758.1 hypothetical protein [Leptobacterium flavescens]
MKEIEEIWDDSHKNPLFNGDSIELPSHITSSELDKLGNVLKIEIVIGFILTVGFFIFRNRMSELAFTLSIAIAVCGLIFSCYGLYLSRKVKVEDNSLLFLKNTLNVLKHFIVKYLVLIQIILICFYFISGFSYPDRTFIDWATSELGIKTSILIFTVDVICLSYGYLFYVKKYLRLKKALKGF